MTGERRLVPTESYSKQGMVTKNYEVKGSTARQPIGETCMYIGLLRPTPNEIKTL